MMTSETIRQLQKMESMIVEYQYAITAAAAGKIYDWLDGVNIFSADTALSRKTRQEQAESLLAWFEDRINDMKAGIK